MPREIDVCIWRMFVFYACCCDCVGVFGNVCCVAVVVKDSVFSLGVLTYIVCLCKGCDGCCVFICLYCDAWSCSCSCMGSMSFFVMQMLYVCVLCASCGSSQSCILRNLQFANAGRRCKRLPYGRGILQSRSRDCFIGSHECLLLFTHRVAVSAFITCSGLCACTEML